MDYKNTKKLRQQQNNSEKNVCFQSILVISQAISTKLYIFINKRTMDLTGKVIAILPAQSGTSSRSGNPWMSQEYVIEVPGTYPRKMVFKVFGEDRIKQFNIQPGEEITVQFDIDAHEWQGRWFNDVRAFNVMRGPVAQSVPAATTIASPAGAAPFPPQQPDAQNAPFPPAQEPAADGAADDLPF